MAANDAADEHNVLSEMAKEGEDTVYDRMMRLRSRRDKLLEIRKKCQENIEIVRKIDAMLERIENELSELIMEIPVDLDGNGFRSSFDFVLPNIGRSNSRF